MWFAGYCVCSEEEVFQSLIIGFERRLDILVISKKMHEHAMDRVQNHLGGENCKNEKDLYVKLVLESFYN